jgi:hypothetical protein
VQNTASGGGFSVRQYSSQPISQASIGPITISIADLNIPVCGLVAALVLFSVRLKTPGGTLKEKLGRMDWMYVAVCTKPSSR